MSVAAWMAVAATASAVGAGISANKQKKSQEQARAQSLEGIEEASALRKSMIERLLAGDYEGFDAEDVFGTKVEPTDVKQAQLAAVMANLGNFGKIDELTDTVNAEISDDALERALKFDPNFSTNVATLSEQARKLIRGEIPDDVYDSVVRGNAGRTASIGTPGTAQAVTARDLGLTSLDLQARGMSIFQGMNAIRDQVDPLSRRLSQTSLLVDPATQIRVDQANKILAAQPDPVAAGLFGIELQGGTQDAYARAGLTIPVDNTLGNAVSSFGTQLGDYYAGQGGNNRGRSSATVSNGSYTRNAPQAYS